MHALDPELLTDARTLAAYLIFIASYFVFALGKFPWMKIDRPGAAIIGAVLMVAFRIVGARDALGSIDFPTIVLLFSMMLIVGNLRVVGFFDWITERVIERLQPHHLLPTVIFSSGLLSAFLVNDVVCLVMTPFVVRLARRLRVTPAPYVIAVATASNIGSVATITGNPQNMLIGSLSGISYVDFAAHLAPVAVSGLFLNWALVLLDLPARFERRRAGARRAARSGISSRPDSQEARCGLGRGTGGVCRWCPGRDDGGLGRGAPARLAQRRSA